MHQREVRQLLEERREAEVMTGVRGVRLSDWVMTWLGNRKLWVEVAWDVEAVDAWRGIGDDSGLLVTVGSGVDSE